MKFPIEQRFKLSDTFIEKYKNIPPQWGFGGLGEFVYMRTYSRIKEDGKNESWYETVRRVVEGVYTIQKQHIDDYNLGWNQTKAQKSAQEMYERIFNFKMLPPGRSLWALGTDIVMVRGLTEALYNCSFLSTKNIAENPGLPFANAMDFLMLGVGVGFDVQGAGKIDVKEKKENVHTFVIPDSREGWVEATMLAINAFFGGNNYEFDYTQIRKAGEPIKTFGGVSSGHEPLKMLHDGINDVLSENIGKPLSARAITDIVNMVGRTVVSGNVRRSAEIVIGEGTEEFLDLKNYEVNPERMAFGWASNNTVYAELGMDYSEIAERIAINGEPGLFWKENARKYGRMRDTEADYKDSRVEGLNPCGEITLEPSELCVSGNTRILTKDGYPMIKDTVGKDVEVWNGKEWSSVTPVQTGKDKTLLRIGFSDGSYLDTTPQHKFSIETSRNLGVSHHKEIEAKNLEIGNTLERLLVNPKELSGSVEPNAFEWGFFAGDGYIDNGAINAVLCGQKEKLISLGLKGKLGKPQIKEGYTDPVNRVYFSKLLENLDVAKELNDKDAGIPEYFFGLDYKSTLEFVAGWLETDGTIQKNETSWHYRIYGSYNKMADLQLLLRRVGVDGVSVSIASREGFETNFGTRSRDLHYITIPSRECLKIPTRYKVIPLELAASGYNKNNAHKDSKLIENARRQRVVSIELLEGKHDTFCFTESKEHKGVFGNVLTYQCNLVELFPNNHESLDDFKKTIKFAYLFAKSITLLNTNWAETNKVMLRNRRIGLSMTGIAQFVAKAGTGVLKNWMEEGYELVKKYDNVYSEWFAVPLSKKTTTFKPSGTISILAGATPGIHFPESKYYIRRVRLAKNSPYIPILKDGNYKVEPSNEDPNGTYVVEFPVSVGDDVKTINDVTMWEQLNLASFCQENWADNSVSVTVTFKEHEKEQIKPALDLFQFKLKAVSFLPKLEAGAYAQMPYEEITKEEFDEMSKRVIPLNFSDMFSTESVGEQYCNNESCAF